AEQLEITVIAERRLRSHASRTARIISSWSGRRRPPTAVPTSETCPSAVPKGPSFAPPRRGLGALLGVVDRACGEGRYGVHGLVRQFVEWPRVAFRDPFLLGGFEAGQRRAGERDGGDSSRCAPALGKAVLEHVGEQHPPVRVFVQVAGVKCG